MTKITFGSFTSAKGNTFQTITTADACAILEKALGMPIGGIGTRGDSVIIFPPKAPKSKATIADERASKGAAGPVASLAEMQAQLAEQRQQVAALLALLQGANIPIAPPVVAVVAPKAGRRKAG